MSVNEAECVKAGVDPLEIDRIARGLTRYAKQAEKLGVTIFGGTGSGTLRIYDDNSPGALPLILGYADAGYWDGGCGAECEDDEGLMRGE